jgi:murein DD-endopeptidase MepM/ murein hydrolase activator NlpD
MTLLWLASKSALLGFVVAMTVGVTAPAPQVSSTSGPTPDALSMADPLPPPRPVLTGFRVPVDTRLRLESPLVPGAPRTYRAGIHEGIDLPALFGTPVRAARAGVVIRVDGQYTEWSLAARARALAEALRLGRTPPATLDRIRGRQVWLDHGRGVVTRYAHLASVGDLRVGQTVEEGAVIGTIGSSGLPEGGPHLHFEIRVGESYLGEGLAEDEVRFALARAFSPAEVWRD